MNDVHRGGARFVAGSPGADEARESSLDFVPGSTREEILEAPAGLALATEEGCTLRPPAAAGSAGPQVVMAGKAEHKQVVLTVIAALENGKPVVDVELPLVGVHSAVLAATTATGDQPAAAGRGELGGSGAAVVGLAEPLAERGLAEEGRECTWLVTRAGATQDTQVRGSSWTAVVEAEKVEDPGPFQPAGFASSQAATKDSRSSTGSDAERYEPDGV